MDSKKRKRESNYPLVTFLTPNRTFERLFREESLDATKQVVRRKLGLVSDATVELTQLRGGKTIDLEDADDFEAFREFAILSGAVEVRVVLPDPVAGGTQRAQHTSHSAKHAHVQSADVPPPTPAADTENKKSTGFSRTTLDLSKGPSMLIAEAQSNMSENAVETGPPTKRKKKAGDSVPTDKERPKTKKIKNAALNAANDVPLATVEIEREADVPPPKKKHAKSVSTSASSSLSGMPAALEDIIAVFLGAKTGHKARGGLPVGSAPGDSTTLLSANGVDGLKVPLGAEKKRKHAKSFLEQPTPAPLQTASGTTLLRKNKELHDDVPVETPTLALPLPDTQVSRGKKRQKLEAVAPEYSPEEEGNVKTKKKSKKRSLVEEIAEEPADAPEHSPEVHDLKTKKKTRRKAPTEVNVEESPDLPVQTSEPKHKKKRQKAKELVSGDDQDHPQINDTENAISSLAGNSDVLSNGAKPSSSHLSDAPLMSSAKTPLKPRTKSAKIAKDRKRKEAPPENEGNIPAGETGAAGPSIVTHDIGKIETVETPSRKPKRTKSAPMLVTTEEPDADLEAILPSKSKKPSDELSLHTSFGPQDQAAAGPSDRTTPLPRKKKSVKSKLSQAWSLEQDSDIGKTGELTTVIVGGSASIQNRPEELRDVGRDTELISNLEKPVKHFRDKESRLNVSTEKSKGYKRDKSKPLSSPDVETEPTVQIREPIDYATKSSPAASQALTPSTVPATLAPLRSWIPRIPSGSQISEVTVESRDEGSSIDSSDTEEEHSSKKTSDPIATSPLLPRRRGGDVPLAVEDIDLDSIIRKVRTPISKEDILTELEREVGDEEEEAVLEEEDEEEVVKPRSRRIAGTRQASSSPFMDEEESEEETTGSLRCLSEPLSGQPEGSSASQAGLALRPSSPGTSSELTPFFKDVYDRGESVPDSHRGDHAVSKAMVEDNAVIDAALAEVELEMAAPKVNLDQRANDTTSSEGDETTQVSESADAGSDVRGDEQAGCETSEQLTPADASASSKTTNGLLNDHEFNLEPNESADNNRDQSTLHPQAAITHEDSVQGDMLNSEVNNSEPGETSSLSSDTPLAVLSAENVSSLAPEADKSAPSIPQADNQECTGLALSVQTSNDEPEEVVLHPRLSTPPTQGVLTKPGTPGTIKRMKDRFGNLTLPAPSASPPLPEEDDPTLLKVPWIKTRAAKKHLPEVVQPTTTESGAKSSLSVSHRSSLVLSVDIHPRASERLEAKGPCSASKTASALHARNGAVGDEQTPSVSVRRSTRSRSGLAGTVKDEHAPALGIRRSTRSRSRLAVVVPPLQTASQRRMTLPPPPRSVSPPAIQRKSSASDPDEDRAEVDKLISESQIPESDDQNGGSIGDEVRSEPSSQPSGSNEGVQSQATSGGGEIHANGSEKPPTGDREASPAGSSSTDESQDELPLAQLAYPPRPTLPPFRSLTDLTKLQNLFSPTLASTPTSAFTLSPVRSFDKNHSFHDDDDDDDSSSSDSENGKKSDYLPQERRAGSGIVKSKNRPSLHSFA